jgi:hypothetical protein
MIKWLHSFFAAPIDVDALIAAKGAKPKFLGTDWSHTDRLRPTGDHARDKVLAEQLTRRESSPLEDGLLVVLLVLFSALPLAAQPRLILEGPRLTPAEAARVLRESPVPSNWTVPPPIWPAGPRVYVIPGTPAEGLWPWPAPRPARRLDGTLLSEPPVVYGLPSRFRDRYPPRRAR